MWALAQGEQEGQRLKGRNDSRCCAPFGENPRAFLLCDFFGEADRLSRIKPPFRANDAEPTANTCTVIGRLCVYPWRLHVLPRLSGTLRVTFTFHGSGKGAEKERDERRDLLGNSSALATKTALPSLKPLGRMSRDEPRRPSLREAERMFTENTGGRLSKALLISASWRRGGA